MVISACRKAKMIMDRCQQMGRGHPLLSPLGPKRMHEALQRGMAQRRGEGERARASLVCLGSISHENMSSLKPW